MCELYSQCKYERIPQKGGAFDNPAGQQGLPFIMRLQALENHL